MRQTMTRRVGPIIALVALAVLCAGPATAGDAPEANGEAAGEPRAAGTRPVDPVPGPGLSAEAAAAARQLNPGGTTAVRRSSVTGTPSALVFRPALKLRGTKSSEAARDLIERLNPAFESALVGGPTELFAVRRRTRGRQVEYRYVQRAGGIVVADTFLSFTLHRTPTGFEVSSVAAQLEPDALLPLGPKPALPSRRPLTLHGLGFDSRPRLRVVRGQDGRWTYGLRCVETGAGAIEEVTRDGSGRVLARRSLCCGGAAEAKVFPLSPTEGDRRVALSGLQLQTEGGLAETNEQGQFPGRRAHIVGPLTSRLDRVVQSRQIFPSTRDGRLVLAFPTTDPRLEQVNVFWHLTRLRRYYQRLAATHAELRETATRPIVATTGLALRGAFALDTATRVQGFEAEASVVFGHLEGRSLAHDASIIAHERAHVSLYLLGFPADGGIRLALHEACADYFGSVYTGSPVIGRYSVGALSRDLSVLRRQPEHRSGDPYDHSLIFSGALYDCRQALGAGFDAVVLHAAKLRFGSGRDYESALEAIVSAASGLGRGSWEAEIRRHFARHGIGAEENTTPVIEVALKLKAEDNFDRREVTGSTIRIPADAEAFELRIRVRDQGQQPRLLARTDLPEGSYSWNPAPAAEELVEYRFEVAKPFPSGRFFLNLVGTDEQLETARNLEMLFTGATPEPQQTLDVSLPAGTEKILDLRPADFEGAVSTRFQGPRTIVSRVTEDNRLVLRPSVTQRGFHDLLLIQHLAGADEPRRITVRVTVTGGPWLDVFTSGGRTGADFSLQSYLPNLDRPLSKVGPGDVITTRRGEVLSLVLRAALSDEDVARIEADAALGGDGDREASAPRNEDPRVELVQGHEDLTFETVAESSIVLEEAIVSDSRYPAQAGFALARLTISETTPPGTITLRFRPRHSSGDSPVRSVQVLVLDEASEAGENRPPLLDAPLVITLGDDDAKLNATVLDPDGDRVTVEFVQRDPPPPAVTLGEASEAGQAVSATLRDPGTYLLEARDSEGNRTRREILVVYEAPGLERLLRPTDSIARRRRAGREADGPTRRRVSSDGLGGALQDATAPRRPAEPGLPLPPPGE